MEINSCNSVCHLCRRKTLKQRTHHAALPSFFIRAFVQVTSAPCMVLRRQCHPWWVPKLADQVSIGIGSVAKMSIDLYSIIARSFMGQRPMYILVSRLYSLNNQNVKGIVSIARKFNKKMQHFSSSHLINFEQVRAISTCRDSSNLLEAGRRPVRSQIPETC